MRKLVLGLLAHVDAGKTTLAESLLYVSGTIRSLGRVDKRDTYLDHFGPERARGITVFTKQALFTADGMQITLLDTPGHADFAAERERTLQVLDYAVLVINGAEGVRGQTEALWRLLARFQLPVFLFVNKMDQVASDKEELLAAIKKQLHEGCLAFGRDRAEDFFEQAAMCDEGLMETYLETGEINTSQLRAAIRERKLFPCYFGSALKLDGVEDLLEGIVQFADTPAYGDKFAARVFKIGRDDQGNRLTYLKITGGKLKVKDFVTNGFWEEKVNQIRIYSGRKFTTASEAEAGTVCAVTGLTQTKAGEGLGEEKTVYVPLPAPVLTYRLLFPAGCDPRAMLPKLRQLAEEEPELHLVWDSQLHEVRVQVMGEVQLEVLQSLIETRYGVTVSFDAGRIVYQETVAAVAEGVGHYAPAGHFAQVRLLLEPGGQGSGLQFADACSENDLGKSWKDLVLSCLRETEHKGVLTGAALTDMKITLLSGRAQHKLTTEGDFREAARRAVRQGLMEAGTLLLEPYYAFQLSVPEKAVGRALTDMERMNGSCRISRIEDGVALLEGSAPVAAMRNYQQEVAAYTGGSGRLFCRVEGYGPCRQAEEIVAMSGYDAELDTENPSGSIFYHNGENLTVSWDQVKAWTDGENAPGKKELAPADKKQGEREQITREEIERIFQHTYFANRGKKIVRRKRKTVTGSSYHPASPLSRLKAVTGKVTGEKAYLLVDGYNIIFAWPALKALAEDNLEAARIKLLDVLSTYQSVREGRIIAVFDAYRVPGHREEVLDYDKIHVVFTREAQTADHFIEKFTHTNREKYQITVATSDNLQQMIIRGVGCKVLSAQKLWEEISAANEKVMRDFWARQAESSNKLQEKLSAEKRKQLEELLQGEE
ncbi:MAG TPA: GTP-binding protein [Firmicutes bacterium]|nr:GTP-binding protein [Bacillota bacterium]